MKDKYTAKVFESDQYDQFYMVRGNRGIMMPHVKKLARSMDDYGWLDSLPATVRRNGRGFEVLDGQNRIEAAKILGISVKYVVVTNEQSHIDIACINGTQRRWTSAHWVKHYADLGYDDYVMLQSFMDEFRVNLTVAATLLSNQPSKATTLADGTFHVHNWTAAETMLGMLRKLSAVATWNPVNAKFIYAFVYIIQVPGFEMDRLVKQVQKYPELFKCHSRIEDIAHMVEHVYNFRSRTPVSIAFEVEQRRKR